MILADAEKIEILITDEEAGLYKDAVDEEDEAEHPGLGEEGRYHEKADEDPLPDGTTLTFALVGNQNSGKTTLFNQLTGSNQHVGNFPGVTVDRKDGVIKGHSNTLITDLPGIYSMSPYSGEELVSRDFVLREKPKAIINIVDVTSIDRSMYLTEQLLEMGLPMVVALNMMDEMTGNGGSVDINKMEQMLGVPVVPISAAQNQGVDELVSHALHVAKYQEGPMRQDFCDSTENGGAVHRCLHAVAHLIEDHAQREGLPVRFAAAKLVEGDQIILARKFILDALGQNPSELRGVARLILKLEADNGIPHLSLVGHGNDAAGEICTGADAVMSGQLRLAGLAGRAIPAPQNLSAEHTFRREKQICNCRQYTHDHPSFCRRIFRPLYRRDCRLVSTICTITLGSPTMISSSLARVTAV